MLRLWKKAPAPSHEELFIEHYGQLLTWALQLTGQDRQKAEDLVHDVFIQFTLIQPSLNEVENLEGYLFASLRNLLRSQMRREARGPGQRLSLVDYDSAEIGWRAVDPRIDHRVRDELSLICHYASVRKESSRAGSALILRFFLGYYPHEIGRILRSSRQAVADLLGAARREAKLYLSSPTRLSFMLDNPATAIVKTRDGDEADDFIGQLRRAIFCSCQGECLPKRKLREIYSSPEGESIENKTLSHIVSCPRCLDIVNQELGLPLLADRYPTDTLGPDQRGSGGGDGSNAGGGKMRSDSAPESIKRFRRRLQDVIEHEPKELHIAINGNILGSQDVNADWNKQNLHLDDAEKITFIEVFSEQGIRLCSLGVEPPPAGPFERAAQVVLSEQRIIQVSLQFNGRGADLQVAYHHPNFKSASAPASTTESLGLIEASATDHEAENPPRHYFSSLIDSWQWLRQWRFDPRFLLRPSVLSLTIALILVGAALFFRTTVPRASAAELLRQSIAKESAVSDPNLILHCAFNVEERDPAGGNLISRRRVESWQNSTLKVMRSYDEQDQLIAGEWRKSDGSGTIYRRGQSSQEIPINHHPADRNVPIGLSARIFSALIGEKGPTSSQTVEEKDDSYVLNFVNQRDGDGWKKATLILRRDDLRAVGQTLVIQFAGKMREQRVSETLFEQHQAGAVAAKVFEPDSELLPPPVKPMEIIGEEEKVAPEVKATPEPSPSPLLLPLAVATAGLEIEALTLLNQVGATLGEEVSVTRMLDGSLRIEGVVENVERRNVILSALAPIRNHQAIKLQIETPEEAQQRLQQTRSTGEIISIQEAAPVVGIIPADGDLRRYLTVQGISDHALDEEVNQFANRTLRRSRQAVLYVWSLRKLMQRFSSAELSALDPAARVKWLAMIGEHAQGFQREIATLRRELSPVFHLDAPAIEPEVGITDEAALARAVLALGESSAAIDEVIRSAFTLSAGGSADIKSTQFWRSISSSEALAKQIQLAAEQLKSTAGTGQR
jgi:DNA-directed RNA polymerase specialized sigma24 family protein